MTILATDPFCLTPASVAVYAMADFVRKCEERACTQLDSAYTVELQALVRAILEFQQVHLSLIASSQNKLEMLSTPKSNCTVHL